MSLHAENIQFKYIKCILYQSSFYKESHFTIPHSINDAIKIQNKCVSSYFIFLALPTICGIAFPMSNYVFVIL